MSSPKSLIFEETAREKLKIGIDKLADIVGITLGPKGHNVGLQAPYGAPKITNDGASIVRDVELKDQYENMGVALGKEVVNKVRELAGDGSTTAIILLRALVEQGVKSIAAGASPILVKRGMEKALEKMIQEIDKLSKPIKNQKDLESIATAAASGNTSIGKKIADAFEKVGKNGVVSIEEGKGTETTLDVAVGMEFDRGYLSSYFCTDREKLTIEIEHPSILLTDKKISSIHEILPLLQAVAATGKELLIIAEDIDGDALSTLVVNKLRGTLKVSAVKAPSFGDRRKAILEDLAILTGGTVVSEEKGMNLKTATEEVLGTAEQVTITKETTIIVGGSGTKEKLKTRLSEIEREIENASSDYDKEKLEERKAKLSGGVAVIRIGAASEAEMKREKHLFDDSLNATKAAIEEGIVLGGGVTLLRASASCKFDLSHDEMIGAKALIKAAEAPFRQLVKNSDCDPSIILEEVLSQKANIGFNASTDTVEDLIAKGVIDPTKVVKTLLSRAVSMACIVLISEVLIGDADEEEKS